MYNQRNDFDLNIEKSKFLVYDFPRATAYGAHKQAYRYHKLRKHVQMQFQFENTSKGLSEPAFMTP